MCSMISGQCDELRETADELDERAKLYAPTASNTLSPMLRQAADTILELRDDLQRANEAVQDAEHDESMAWDRVRKVEAENAELRELVLHTVECVRRLSDTSENGGCVPCPYQSIDYDCDFENRARELGVG